MLNTIKNSLFSKCLQVLLIGYFLISSLNVSNSFVRIIYDNADIHSVTGLTCNFLKKIFKCNAVQEEIDDYEAKDTKATKQAKGTLLLDYLIPVDTSLAGLYFEIESQKRNYIENPIFSFGFHGKIHLRPPQIIV
ncbi:MAG: hypothetical protein ABI892_20335 [Flavobacterium sp.]